MGDEGYAKIDRSFLPPECVVHEEGTREDGLVAKLYPDGQLRELAVYRAGRVRSDLLALEHGVARGRSGDPEQWDRYRDGTVERFDAWSDSSRPRPMDWVQWVRGEIERIRRAR